MREVMALAAEANRYLDDNAPWKIDQDGSRAGGHIAVCNIAVINALKILTAPFLPFSAQKLHEMLGLQR